MVLAAASAADRIEVDALVIGDFVELDFSGNGLVHRIGAPSADREVKFIGLLFVLPGCPRFSHSLPRI